MKDAWLQARGGRKTPFTRVGRWLGAAARVVSAPGRKISKAFRSRRRSVLAAKGPGASADKIPSTLYLEAAQLAADDGMAALSHALSNPNPEARVLALEVICEFSQERASRILSRMTLDPEPTVRAAAADAAGRIQASGTVFSLIFALDDPEESVRTAAAIAIETITGKSIAHQALSTPTGRHSQIALLKNWWKEQRLTTLTEEVRREVELD
jgi:hypothetical protein